MTSGVRRRARICVSIKGCGNSPKTLRNTSRSSLPAWRNFVMDGSRRIAFSGDQSVIPSGSISARCSPSKRLNQPQLRVISARTNKFSIQGYRRKGTDGFTQRSQRIVRGNHLVIQIVFSLVGVKKRRINRRLTTDLTLRLYCPLCRALRHVILVAKFFRR